MKMWISKNKLEKMIDDRVDKKIKMDKWLEFLKADKKGFIIKYDGMEWECEDEIFDLKLDRWVPYEFQKIILSIGNQKKSVEIRENNPIEMDFVYE